MTISENDLFWLARAVELAQEAFDAGDLPFGTVLVDADGNERFADRNRVSGGDHTRHPEFELARWAAAYLTPDERAEATVYTSGEHCVMCAAAHGWVGLGRIVYAASAAQLVTWLTGWGLPPAPVVPLPITAVVPGAVVDGPAPEFEERLRELQRRARGVVEG
jgi:tRNA(Arg) A34 adenosine deaminase TadA